jgi:hypothetical protein
VGIVTAENNGYIVSVTDQIKNVTFTLFSLTASQKKFNESIVIITYLPEKWEWLHHYRYLAF